MNEPFFALSISTHDGNEDDDDADDADIDPCSILLVKYNQGKIF
jgi:hypothetical protein